MTKPVAPDLPAVKSYYKCFWSRANLASTFLIDMALTCFFCFFQVPPFLLDNVTSACQIIIKCDSSTTPSCCLDLVNVALTYVKLRWFNFEVRKSYNFDKINAFEIGVRNVNSWKAICCLNVVKKIFKTQDNITFRISFKCDKTTRWSNFLYKTIVQTRSYVLPNSYGHIVIMSTKSAK